MLPRLRSWTFVLKSAFLLPRIAAVAPSTLATTLRNYGSSKPKKRFLLIQLYPPLRRHSPTHTVSTLS